MSFQSVQEAAISQSSKPEKISRASYSGVQKPTSPQTKTAIYKSIARIIAVDKVPGCTMSVRVLQQAALDRVARTEFSVQTFNNNALGPAGPEDLTASSKYGATLAKVQESMKEMKCT